MNALMFLTPCFDDAILPYDKAESLAVATTVRVFPFIVVVSFVTSGPLAMLKGALVILAKYVRVLKFLGSIVFSNVVQS